MAFYNRCYYFAAQRDHEELVAFIESLGLTVVPNIVGEKPTVDFDNIIHNRLRFLSPLPMENIHKPEINKYSGYQEYSNSNTQLIRWSMGYLDRDFFVDGRFEWTNLGYKGNSYSSEILAENKEIGKYWRKIRNWMKKNWVVESSDFFFGHGAQYLFDEKKYEGGTISPYQKQPKWKTIFVK